ncbi:hypothetical protein GQ457_03G043620 [Hibiscus cannabinus]
MNLYGSAAACRQHLEIRGQKVHSALDYRACSLMIVKSQEHRRKLSTRSPALAETAASVAIAAATFLVRRTKASDPTEVPSRPCEYCKGCGICSGCKGQGFVLKKMSEKGADGSWSGKWASAGRKFWI